MTSARREFYTLFDNYGNIVDTFEGADCVHIKSIDGMWRLKSDWEACQRREATFGIFHYTELFDSIDSLYALVEHNAAEGLVEDLYAIVNFGSSATHFLPKWQIQGMLFYMPDELKGM